MSLKWIEIDGFTEDAIIGDFQEGDGVRFSLTHMPTAYRRGPWRLLIEVAGGLGHLLWGCFDGQDQPQRWYHKKENAISEAEAIADVLSRDRKKAGYLPGKR